MQSRTGRRLPLAFLGAALALALPLALPSEASARSATRGDAEAAFRAFFTGGSAIRLHNPDAEGAPGVPIEPPPEGARIYPGIDDAVYCQEGWHVVLLGVFDDPTFYASRRELFEYLSAVSMEFVLDGVPLEVERTSITSFPHPDPNLSENPMMVVNFGAFLPPGALSLGTHELQTTFHDPVFGDFDFAVSFNVVAC